MIKSRISRRGFLGTGALAGFAGLSSQALLSACSSPALRANESLPTDTSDTAARGGEWQFEAVTIHPSNASSPRTLPAGTVRKVLVVGGGLAGLSAAIELAERGYQVTVREAAPQLGGRLSTRDETLSVGKFRVEHGLHMWFYQYYNFLDLLGKSRLDVLDKHFVDFKEVYYLFENYKPELLKSEGPYPFNLLGIVLGSQNLNILSAAGSALALPDLIGYDHSTVNEKYDNITFADYARKKLVNKDFYNIILEPAASVTLNDPNKVSAAEMLTFTNIFFLGHPKAFWRRIPNTDHGTAVIDPMAAHIEKFGGVLETSSPVKGLVITDGRVTGCVGEAETYDQVVLACDVPGAKKILAGSQATDARSAQSMRELKAGIDFMKVAPPYHILRVWLDKPIRADRPFSQACIETPNFLPVHLIGIMSMIERECIDWAEATGGCVIEYHLYNTPEFAADPATGRKALTAEQIWEKITATAVRITPEIAGAKPLAFSLGGYHNFTSYEVGQASSRLDALSPRGVGIENLAIAGDWIATSYPSALMERAVSTGRECANIILLEDNVRMVPLRVPRSRGPGLWPKF